MKNTELLDRALNGKPPEARARVLDLVVKLGIDPEDEFFLIFIAIGQLQVLIEDSPQQWQETFTSFEGELDAWSESNLKVLEALVHKAEATDSMAQSLKELISLLNNLCSTLNTLLEKQETSDSGLNGSMKKLSTSFRESLDLIDINRRENKRQNEQLFLELEALKEAINTSNSRKTRFLPIALTSSVAVVLSLVSLFVVATGEQNREALQLTNQRTEWLVRNTIKRECAAKMRATVSPECLKN